MAEEADSEKPILELDFVVKDPPLKRLKQHLTSISTAYEPRTTPAPELSPNSLKSQLKQDESLLIGVLKESASHVSHESVLEKWRSSVEDVNGSKDDPADFSYLSDDIFDLAEEKVEVEDEFEDFDFELNELEVAEKDLKPPFQSSAPFERVKVVTITESFYEREGRKFRFPEKILECLKIANGRTEVDFAPLKVVIRDDWLHCRFGVDSVINVIGPIENGQILIDNDHNYIITEPDQLISTTTISDAFACLRRAVLSFRTKASIEDNKPSESLICGSIVHELVEEAFKSGNFADSNAVTKDLEALIHRHIESIFCCDRDEAYIRNKVVEMMQNFPSWCQMYLRRFPAIHAFVQDQLKTSASFGKKPNSATEKATICIPKIIELEENIWSVMFGIKGKVDATVLMKFKDGQKQNYAQRIVPFELKTGNSTTSVSHRAQTLLYTLMLHDRYKRPVDFGLLFYISTGDLVRIPAWREEIRSIVISRNRLAEELVLSEQLPPQISNEHLCKKCFQLDACVMYHRLHENGKKETSSAPSKFEAKTAHLPDDNLKLSEFFSRWQNLITLEEAESVAARSELWKFEADKRAASGRCFNDMKLVSCEEIENAVGMNRFKAVFTKHKANTSSSLLTVHISEGDPIVVSCQLPKQYAIAVGFVASVTPNLLIITTDRRIKHIPEPEEALDGAEDSESWSQLQSGAICARQAGVFYRIDKDELTSSFGLLRTNIFKLFSAESNRLLQLIVEKQVPRFTSALPNTSEALLREYGMWDEYCGLDEFQRAAFIRTTQCLDYLLVLGMPGTGKTTTLAFVIHYLVHVLGKSVLISSHTHSAIDHIALKLQSKNVNIVRIGNSDKVDKMIDSTALLSNQEFKTVSEVETYYAKAQVVICTSLGINHPIFMRKRFDYCIVDEASQLTLPSCVGPLRLAQSFVLVGDHYQLPPLVRSKAALKEGFGESLFKQLAETHPQAMVQLRSQYRMNEEIMLVANRLVYNNLLRCGSEAVGRQRLETAHEIRSCLSCEANLQCWLRIALDPNRKVLFLNTDDLDAYETSNGPSFHNEIESQVIYKFINAAKAAGIGEEEMSLISPYRPQLKYLTFEDCPGVEVSTIDKYQGKDRECVIISLVRSNPLGNIGELLTDWQRLNVAFTRAKKKLILVGSARTVLHNSAFRKLLLLVEEQGWLFNLPKDSLTHELIFK